MQQLTRMVIKVPIVTNPRKLTQKHKILQLTATAICSSSVEA